MMRIVIDSQHTERVRLEQKLGKKKSSLWNMNKAELKDKAIADLGMTAAQMKDETLTSLRERLRSQKEVTDMLQDPLAKAPKGLDSLKKDELRSELLQREINEPDKCTRPKMIVLIRDDVARRITMERPVYLARNLVKNNSNPEDPAFKDAESDEEMVIVEKTTRRKR